MWLIVLGACSMECGSSASDVIEYQYAQPSDRYAKMCPGLMSGDHTSIGLGVSHYMEKTYICWLYSRR